MQGLINFLVFFFWWTLAVFFTIGLFLLFARLFGGGGPEDPRLHTPREDERCRHDMPVWNCDECHNERMDAIVSEVVADNRARGR